jgi:AbiJ N-terminal domain 4
MPPRTRFSDRHGHSQPDAEITIRHDAPHELRGIVADLAYESGLSPTPLRGLVCRELRTREDPGNWSEWPNIAGEVSQLLDGCDWFEVYDIIEAIYDFLIRRSTQTHDGEHGAEHFSLELNRYFRRSGIGWQLSNGLIAHRGPEVFEQTVRTAQTALETSNRVTATREVSEALQDLSRRPIPDVTGALQHAMAALECVARDITGNPRATLGEILKRHPDLFPPPVDQAMEKLWGFASERGRHLREGRDPDMEEAELIVGLASVGITYLLKKTSS